MPDQPTGIQQRIHDFLRQRLVCEEGIDWVNIQKLAEDLVSELLREQFGHDVKGRKKPFPIPMLSRDSWMAKDWKRYHRYVTEWVPDVS